MIPTCRATSGRVNRWFRTEAFAQPPPFTFGNAGRNIVQGPGIINIDLSLSKRIPVRHGEKPRVPGRGLQRGQPSDLGMPNVNLSSAAYGRITSTRIDSRQTQLALRFTF